MKSSAFLKEVMEMARVDQDLRFAAIRAKRGRKVAGLSFENYLVYAVDRVHGLRLRELIKKYGYPKKKEFGDDGLASFWLLVQHQDHDVDLQKACAAKCNLSSDHYAHLMDRICVNTGKKQIYGTQYTGKIDRAGRPILCPTRDPKRLQKRRHSIGLK